MASRIFVALCWVAACATARGLLALDDAQALLRGDATNVTERLEVDPTFKLGDKVEVRDDESDEWKPGVVSSESPVTPDGWEVGFRWAFVRPASSSSDSSSSASSSPASSSSSADESLQAAEPADEPPKEPGCYVKMPTGCSRRGAEPTGWKRDEWGEENVDAQTSEAACLKRKQSFQTYCGNSDVEMGFRRALEPGEDPLADQMPLLPAETGCYVWMPTGCPKNINFQGKDRWHRDDYLEQQEGGVSMQGCEKRARSFNSWCGSTEARMRFVAPQAPPPPLAPGCYVRHPSGCAKQNIKTRNVWKRDAHGEAAFGAALSREACEINRKRMFDSWCGTEDAETVFVGRSRAPHMPFAPPTVASAPPAEISPFAVPAAEMAVANPAERPQQPEAPGCYVWMPTGCPYSRSFDAVLDWKRDEYGEENKGADLSKKACEGRGRSFNSWCGTYNSQMLFIAAPPPADPTEPGCYVRHPTGCPNQQLRDFTALKGWKRDAHGEEVSNAASSRSACEMERKNSFDAWCGVDDTSMYFVPA